MMVWWKWPEVHHGTKRLMNACSGMNQPRHSRVMTAFPDVKPSRRSYTPGRFSYTQFEAQNRAVSLLRYGDRRTNAELNLGFDNINDEYAQAIIDNYDSVMTDTDGEVTFSTKSGLAGLSKGSLRNEVDTATICVALRRTTHSSKRSARRQHSQLPLCRDIPRGLIKLD